MVINIAHVLNFPNFPFYKKNFSNKSIFCCSYFFVVINISKLLQYVLSFEGLEKVDLQVLDTKWQTIGFLYGIIRVRFEVLVRQVTCIVLGRVLLRTKVQFPLNYNYNFRNVSLWKKIVII
jgi:hypothetical protein